MARYAAGRVFAVLGGAAVIALISPVKSEGTSRLKKPSETPVSFAAPVFFMAAPASFAASEGQAPAPITFRVQTPQLTASFHPAGIDFTWLDSSIYLRFDGSAENAVIEGSERLSGRANFLTGNDPRAWRTNVQLYGAVRYRELYPGIDMVYSGETARRIKSTFVVTPGADPGLIRMRYHGVRSTEIASDGALLVTSSRGVLREEPPLLYQDDSGVRREVAGRYVRHEDGSVGFAVGAYDASRTLWIDPALSFSTLRGGGLSEQITGVAVDALGYAYVTGWTESTDFPVSGALQQASGGVDAFVLKLSPSGTVEYATYIGGGKEDRPAGIDVDNSGNAYISGHTTSTNFPLAAALQGTLNGSRDAFVLKLNSAGSALVYSTYYGGAGAEWATGVDVDDYGQAYVAGSTDSVNFPLRFPFQGTLVGQRDAFSFKIGIAGQISYSTYFGGAGDDWAAAIAVSGSLTPYLVGCTTSKNFPLLNPLQSSLRGGQDAFVARFNSDANILVYSTYLGGNSGASSRPECAYAVALDAYNNAYVTGVTSSRDYPILAAFQNAHGGGTLDAFVTKIDSGGAALYSSYLGGRGSDYGMAIRVDSSRRAYIGGYTNSANFPLVNAFQTVRGGGYDGFVTRVDVSGTLLNHSSYLGGGGNDMVQALAYQSGGFLVVAGQTLSANFPLLTPVQSELKGSFDGFITRLSGF